MRHERVTCSMERCARCDEEFRGPLIGVLVGSPYAQRLKLAKDAPQRQEGDEHFHPICGGCLDPEFTKEEVCSAIAKGTTAVELRDRGRRPK